MTTAHVLPPHSESYLWAYLVRHVILQQEARTAARDATATAKEELRKLATEQRAAAKLLKIASHQAAQAAASLADKRAELTAVKESNQELQEQHIQETQVQFMSLRTGARLHC